MVNCVLFYCVLCVFSLCQHIALYYSAMKSIQSNVQELTDLYCLHTRLSPVSDTR
ncbi:unnamed protein product [Staurois parvus]|uniref:Uncharacterized protein n=1 Tax=Staurois parvus TaxID=386267 RepID=A0ABN9FLG3_9NEOB|nr:unnamed protein product [Staurois parvus]